MYRESVRYYDEIYSYKDYKKEAEKIHRSHSHLRGSWEEIAKQDGPSRWHA